MQVLLSDAEYQKLRDTARSNGVSAGEWVRRALQESYMQTNEIRKHAKLAAIERALLVNGPTCDIDQMNAEIEAGYASGLP
jgi:hypothetical protein